MSDSVLYHLAANGVATVSLNRPELFNAVDGKLLDRLHAVLQELSDTPNVRALILTGGGMNFSAGSDAEWLAQSARFSCEELETSARKLAALLQTLDNFRTPVVARVQGSAFGIGVGLIACCDLVIASSESLFRFSDVKLGRAPTIIAPYIIRAIGPRATRRYFMSVERLNAGKARRLGLLHQVVETEELENTVNFHVQNLLSNGPNAMASVKRIVNALHPVCPPEKLEYLVKEAGLHADSAETKEGIQAFLDKRLPSWIQ